MFQAPVLRLLLTHAGASVLLGSSALVAGSVGGFTAGTLAAVTGSRLLAASIRVGAPLAYAAPVFWTGQMLVFLASVKLGLLPAGGLSSAREALTGAAYAVDVARHLVLPARTHALPFAAVIAGVTRASVLEVLREPYVRALQARGLSRTRIVTRHVARIAVLPVSALVGQHAAQVVAGGALTEALFAWPGVGYLDDRRTEPDEPLARTGHQLWTIGDVCDHNPHEPARPRLMEAGAGNSDPVPNRRRRLGASRACDRIDVARGPAQ